MLRHQAGRAVTFAAIAALLVTGTAFADTVTADGDLVTSGTQGTVDLGTVAPGATITRDVNLTLICSGLRHVDPGQLVTVTQTGAVTPAEGGSITATDTTIGPVPAEWANDTAGISGCASAFRLDATVPSHATIVAPTTPGTGYAFTITYGKLLAPAGVSDGTSVTGFTAVTFTLNVADKDTTPPAFTSTPADVEVTTTDPSGAPVSYDLPSATDDRDPSPTVACDPASGVTFPVGSSTVTCTATDASGNQASETFTVTVHLAAVAWEDPVHGADVSVTRGRSLPLKVRASLDGAPLSGDASFVVITCGDPAGSASMSVAGVWQADAARWMAVLDTSSLDVGCHRVSLVVKGLAVGSFGLEVVAPPSSTTALGRGGHRPG